MLETAFTLLGTPVTWLEVLAFVLALANIACNVWEIHWGWPLTVVASSLYAWLFYASGLYGESGVNVFFVVAAMWGWWQWLRGRRANSDAPLQVEKLDAAGLKKAAVAWLLMWLACSALLHFVTDSNVVWADGFVTAGSIVGTVLLGRKFIDNWPTWVIVNVASIALFAYKGLVLTVVLYVIFLGLAFWGWWGWNGRYRQRHPSTTRI
ncbi:MAG: nicotinamide mononucleotide transporter [Rhodoferax sp.]|nr:nicotinamide mononucleotide transporter [Rhodoferax sp.]